MHADTDKPTHHAEDMSVLRASGKYLHHATMTRRRTTGTSPNRINARYGEAVQTCADRIVEYVDRRDEPTGELAKYLDQLARKGIDAERLLALAAARKPLPIDHPTAALGYRVKDLVTPRKRRPAPSIDPFPRPSQQQSGPSLGM